jgi:hypothetical protein
MFFFFGAVLGDPIRLGLRKAKTDDHTFLLFLIIAAVIAFAAAVIGCLVCYFSAPRTTKEEVRPLISQSRPKFTGTESPLPNPTDYRYWPGQMYYPQIPAVYFPTVSQGGPQ